MSKSIKNETKRMTKKRALSCLVAAAVVVSSGVVIFNKTEITPSAALSSGQDVNQKSKVIIDSNEKVYSNINLAANSAEFDFKVPSYIVDDNCIFDINVNNTSNGNKAVNLRFVSNDDNKFSNQFRLFIFQGDSPEETIKSIKYMEKRNAKEETKELTLGAIKGKEITYLENDVDGNLSTEKVFLWQDNGVWYAIEYKNMTEYSAGGEPYVLEDLSEAEVQKVAESLVEVSKANKEQYETEMDGLQIYTEGDLKYAAEKLGFEPKLFTEIDEELVIEWASVNELHEKDNMTPTGKYIVHASYGFNSKSAAIYEEKINDESSDLKAYTETLVKAQGGTDYEKVEGTDVEAYKYEIAVEGKDETILNYVWNKDGANYRIVIYNGKIENADYDLALKLINK